MCVALVASLALGELALRRLGFGHPLRYEHDPALSWRIAPNQLATAPRYGVAYAINSRGWREREVAVHKAAGTFRILGIGDSVTFGQGVAREDTYLARLEALLGAKRPVEVLNTAVPNYNAQHYRALVEDPSLFALEPDLLLLGFAKNDAVSAAESAALHRHAEQGLAFDMDTLRGRGRRSSAWFHLVDGLVQRLRYRFGDAPRGIAYTSGIPDAAAWAFTLEAMRDLADRAAAAQVPVLVAVFPRRDEVLGDALVVDPAPLARLARERGLDYLDLTPPFRRHADQPLFYDIVHPTARGNAVAAEAIAARLSARLATPR